MDPIPPSDNMRSLSPDEKHIRGLDEAYKANVDQAVIISAPTSISGIRAEYDYIQYRHGKRDEGWKLETQVLLKRGGRSYDVICVQLGSGERKYYCFDITEYFGKLGWSNQ